ncbi:MAG: YwqG family protein [Rhodobacteraceae bacterium]|nr:YwqG family protein [Paracoccaceae bacterium]
MYNPKKLTDWDEYDTDIPMHFFAQLNLAEMPTVPGLPQMPRSGTFFVFFDPVVAFGPYSDDLGSLTSGERVRLGNVAEDVSGVAARTPSAFPDFDLTPAELLSDTHMETHKETGPEFGVFPQELIVFHTIETWHICSQNPGIDGYPTDVDTAFSHRQTLWRMRSTNGLMRSWGRIGFWGRTRV